MKDSTAPKIQDLLPELFTQSAKPVKPGGMCTPGSGCDPAAQAASTDLLKMLNGSIPAPPAPREDAGNSISQPYATETIAPGDEEETPRE